MNINIRGELYSFDTPKIMGILNVTPDSFYDGGSYQTAEKIKQRVEQILTQGADFIDVGAYSTRPGANEVTAEQEWQRVVVALEIINKMCPECLLSLDTFRANVARRAVEDYGVAIINDISAGSFDPLLLPTVADLHVPYILMHMLGTPRDMQHNPTYNNVVNEVIFFLSHKVDELHRLGVEDIIIDPGFGFGKTIEHNYILMRHLRDFLIFDMPILVGISRKSMIYKLLDSSPHESLNGTTVLNTLALNNGANILRVHDVKQAVEVKKIYKYYLDK